VPKCVLGIVGALSAPDAIAALMVLQSLSSISSSTTISIDRCVEALSCSAATTQMPVQHCLRDEPPRRHGYYRCPGRRPWLSYFGPLGGPLPQNRSPVVSRTLAGAGLDRLLRNRSKRVGNFLGNEIR
jgi:hypothetical protein